MIQGKEGVSCHSIEGALFNHKAPASWSKTVDRMKLLKVGESVWNGMQDGRKLDASKPSFTLRSGCRHLSCGYIVHPTQPRMLSVRECCRLQSFPDSFRVFGPVIEQFKQIGNAVPPLLARAVAHTILGAIQRKSSKRNPVTVMSLFTGAGGLSLGFKMAGFKTVLGLDNNRYCAQTFDYNFPEAAFVLKDARKTSVEALKKPIGSIKPDAIVAGVPCQGFSIAGKRMIDDPRNALYKEFVRIVDGIRPKWIIVENVVGLLSMKTANQTLIANEIVQDFERIGFRVRHRILNAASYGVPQIRQRVFFIGNSSNELIEFPAETHASSFQRTIDNRFLFRFVTVEEAISDLPSLRSGEGEEESEYSTPPKTQYQKLMRGEISYEEWLSSLGMMEAR